MHDAAELPTRGDADIGPCRVGSLKVLSRHLEDHVLLAPQSDPVGRDLYHVAPIHSSLRQCDGQILEGPASLSFGTVRIDAVGRFTGMSGHSKGVADPDGFAIVVAAPTGDVGQHSRSRNGEVDVWTICAEPLGDQLRTAGQITRVSVHAYKFPFHTHILVLVGSCAEISTNTNNPETLSRTIM